MNVFPVHFHCHDMGKWVQCPELATRIWNRVRPKNFSWYCVDLEVLSPEKVKIFVYDMENMTFGGIGKQIHEQEIVEFTPAECVILDKMVESIYTAAAEVEFQKREEAARTEKIMELRRQLFGV